MAIYLLGVFAGKRNSVLKADERRNAVALKQTHLFIAHGAAIHVVN